MKGRARHVQTPTRRDGDVTVNDDLARLAKLPRNWDSYGANELTAAAVESARSLIERPRVAPSVDGGVSVTWTNEHIEVDVTILPDGTFGDVTAERFVAPDLPEGTA